MNLPPDTVMISDRDACNQRTKHTLCLLGCVWGMCLVGLLSFPAPSMADSRVVAWGAGTTNSGQFPDFGQAIVPQDLTNAIALAGGESFSMALRADGTVVAWGDNSSGQTNVPADLTNAVAI